MFQHFLPLLLVIVAVFSIASASPFPQGNKKPQYGITPSPTATKNSPAGPSSSVVNPFNLTFVVSARDLKGKKQGPYYIKVSHKGTKDAKEWTLIADTETLKGTNNPDFLKVFNYEWVKGRNQQWRFEVKTPHTLSKDELLGVADVNIDDYVLLKNQQSTIILVNGTGSIILKRVDPVKFRLYARMVPALDNLKGLSDPFVQCYWRKGKEGNDTLFFTTKVIQDSESPDWNEDIVFSNYQKGQDMWWHFKVQDEDSVSGNDFVGEALMEIDPFVQNRKTVNKMLSKTNKAVLSVTAV